jgi:hypothetical protein
MTLGGNMGRVLALALVMAISPAAHAQATVYPGVLDLPLMEGHAIGDCAALAPEDPDNPGPPDTTGAVCILPGSAGGGVEGMRGYVAALRDKGFTLQPTNMQTPVLYFCRGAEVVMFTKMPPHIMMNEDLDYIDENGAVTTMEALIAKAPMVLLHKPEGPCSYL